MKLIYYFFPKNTYRRVILKLFYKIILNPKSFYNYINLINLNNLKNYGLKKFYCNVCGNQSRAIYDFPDIKIRTTHKIGVLRESLFCNCCGSTMRDRTLAAGILLVLNEKTGYKFKCINDLKENKYLLIKIWDTDNFSPISKILKNTNFYIRSSYLSTEKIGKELEKNYYNINLEKISFESNTFDIIISSDVMEHVRDYKAAHMEISRVLKNGGKYIFTVPYDEHCETNHILVDTSTKNDIHLTEPHIHGDPITGGILAYRIFGKNIFKEFSSLRLKLEFFKININKNMIKNGDIFIAEKKVNSI